MRDPLGIDPVGPVGYGPSRHTGSAPEPYSLVALILCTFCNLLGRQPERRITARDHARANGSRRNLCGRGDPAVSASVE